MNSRQLPGDWRLDILSFSRLAEATRYSTGSSTAVLVRPRGASDGERYEYTTYPPTDMWPHIMSCAQTISPFQIR